MVFNILNRSYVTTDAIITNTSVASSMLLMMLVMFFLLLLKKCVEMFYEIIIWHSCHHIITCCPHYYLLHLQIASVSIQDCFFFRFHCYCFFVCSRRYHSPCFVQKRTHGRHTGWSFVAGQELCTIRSNYPQFVIMVCISVRLSETFNFNCLAWLFFPL